MGDKKREDSWNDEHDQLLAEVVLSHIRTGSTQLAAFEVSGKPPMDVDGLVDERQNP
ncbi:RsfA family transcription factor [Paenibacillus sp. V4I9]|uniref:hypothetical protein n=1 Tax=Paenibacillus TaxID=44249 RepID=UPI001491C9AD|nr:RsfA family transcription factor [Paenibacillus sp. V4I9]MDQ0896826.1 RsfA family transcription factor [Paenibacillus sp. V4I7]